MNKWMNKFIYQQHTVHKRQEIKEDTPWLKDAHLKIYVYVQTRLADKTKFIP